MKKYVKPETEIVAVITLAEMMIPLGGGSSDEQLVRTEYQDMDGWDDEEEELWYDE